MSTAGAEKKKPKDDRWSTDLGVAGAFGLWAVIFLVAPPYLDLWPSISVACTLLAILSGLIAAIGSLIALGKLVKHEAFGYIGTALVFLVPAASLFGWAMWGEIGSPWLGLIKFATLLLAALGGAIAIYGLSLFLEPRKPTVTPRVATRSKRASLQSVNASLIALIGLATAVVGLVSALRGDGS